MAEVLSQGEIDGLLSAISAGGEESAEGALCQSQRRIKIYDFKRPDKFSKDQIVTMQIMHETFARLATTTLSAALRELVSVHVASVDQLTYEEFIRAIPTPTTLAVVGMDPLKGQAVLEIDPSIAFSIIDRLFGGAAGPGASLGMNRALTDIECSAMEGIVVRLLGNLREAWAQVLDLKPRLGAIETNPQFAQVVPPNEMIVLVTLEARIGEVLGMMNLCFPYLTIEPIISMLSAQYWYTAVRRNASSEDERALLGHIQGFEVPAQLLVEAESLSLRELGALKRGSLVGLPGLDRGTASFRMGGRDLFKLKSLPRKRGSPQAYEIVAKPPERELPSLEGPRASAELGSSEELTRKILEEFRAGLGSTLSGIANGLSALGRKQDELADRLGLGPVEAELPGSAAAPDRLRPFDFVKRTDPSQVLNFLQAEHPQTIALVLSYLEPQAAARILGGLPFESQPEIARRIACMDRTMPEVIREVERVLEKKLETIGSEDYLATGGVQSVAEILNISSRSTEKYVVEALEEESPELADEIKKRMFVFEDIVLLERDAVAKVVMRSEGETFLRAMKAVDEEIRDRIWACLPKAEFAELKARFEAVGRVRLSEVEAAQQRVIDLVRSMEESGEIVVARPDETVE
jgi:flagellar motor switch protein FliM